MHPFYFFTTSCCCHFWPPLGRIHTSEYLSRLPWRSQTGQTARTLPALVIRSRALYLKMTRTKLPDFSSKVCDLYTDFSEENVSNFWNEWLLKGGTCVPKGEEQKSRMVRSGAGSGLLAHSRPCAASAPISRGRAAHPSCR